MTHNTNNIKGVALIQVLLISAILSMLAIQLNKSAKVNTHLTLAFEQKMEATIDLRDVESVLFYKLLSKDSEQINSIEGLNYYGEPFLFNEFTTVKIQDTAGLNNLHFPNSKIIKKWALNNNIEEYQAELIISQLKDWQDSDEEALPGGAESSTYQNYGYTSANVKLSSPKHLEYLLGLNREHAKSLASISTVQAYSSLNPYHFPKRLLYIYYGDSIADEVINLRLHNEINRSIFTKLTGDSEDEDKSFSVSPYLSVEIKVNNGEAIVTKLSTIELVPFFKKDQTALSKLNIRLD